MGLHADKVPVPEIVMMAKYLLVAEILYVYNLVWTKLSFLMMYYRIFRFPYFKRWAFAIGGFVIMWVITVTFLFVFICVPVQKLWYPQLPGHCINQVGTWIANATSTIVTDLAILILPIPQVWTLHLKRSEKIALTIIFSLGFLCVSQSSEFWVILTLIQRGVCFCLSLHGTLLIQRERSDLYSRPHRRLDRNRNVCWHHLSLPPNHSARDPFHRSQSWPAQVH